MNAAPPEARRAFTAENPDYVQRVRESFGRQRVMSTLGISLQRIEPGLVELTMPFNHELTQQNGFIHAGIIAAALDTACGYAALSLFPASADILTVEFKTNLLAPAEGSRFSFCGEAVKLGRTLTVCDGRAISLGPAGQKLIATMTATLIALHQRSSGPEGRDSGACSRLEP